MRNSKLVFVLSASLFNTCIPVYAQDLLGGLGSVVESVVSVDSGSASGGSLVSVGVGGSDGGSLDVRVGGGSSGGGSIARASVGSSSDGGLGVSANVLGGTATADVGLGGSGGTGARVNLLNDTATVDVNLGGPGRVLDVNVNVGVPNINLPNGPGIPGVPRIRVLNAVVNGQQQVVGVGGGVGIAAAPNCGSDISGQVSSLMDGTSVDSSWQSASGVQVQRVDMCPAMREWVAEQAKLRGHGSILHPAVRADSLISASLSRSPYSAQNVFAVRKTGGKLTIYVY